LRDKAGYSISNGSFACHKYSCRLRVLSNQDIEGGNRLIEVRLRQTSRLVSVVWCYGTVSCLDGLGAASCAFLAASRNLSQGGAGFPSPCLGTLFRLIGRPDTALTFCAVVYGGPKLSSRHCDAVAHRGAPLFP
jgi:hypothetical protein